MWKGTEVAVKKIAAEQITREMQRNFNDEVCAVCRTTIWFSSNYFYNLFLGESHDFTKAPERCLVHGCLHQIAKYVYCDGIYGLRIPV